MMATQEELDEQAERIKSLIEPHMERLYRARRDLMRAGRAHHRWLDLEVQIPREWDRLGLGEVGKVFALPVVAADVEEPTVRVTDGNA
jgi:hypothetical protein